MAQGNARTRSPDPRDLLTGCFLFFVAVHKPEKVTWTEAAGTVRDGVRAYTALHYLARLAPGKWVLVMDGASVGADSVSTDSHTQQTQGRPPIINISLPGAYSLIFIFFTKFLFCENK